MDDVALSSINITPLMEALGKAKGMNAAETAAYGRDHSVCYAADMACPPSCPSMTATCL